VPVATMPGWLQVFAKYQPLTYMVDAARALTLGSSARVELGHPASYYAVRALAWTAGILVVSVPLAVARYRRG
jgi:ABC-2 type transport system permease protein